MTTNLVATPPSASTVVPDRVRARTTHRGKLNQLSVRAQDLGQCLPYLPVTQSQTCVRIRVLHGGAPYSEVSQSSVRFARAYPSQHLGTTPACLHGRNDIDRGSSHASAGQDQGFCSESRSGTRPSRNLLGQHRLTPRLHRRASRLLLAAAPTALAVHA